MKYIISLILIFTICGDLFSQTVPPEPYSKFSAKWYKFFNYISWDSLGLMSLQDTSLTPYRGGAFTTWQNAGVDTTIWFYDGAKWVRVATGSGGGGASEDTVNVSNVLSFGADTTGVTDATEAINNAINQAVLGVKGKMRVYLPHGTYLIDISYLKVGGDPENQQGIQLLDNIELYGDGVGKTILIVGDNTTHTTANSYIFPIINGYGVSNCYVHDIEIQGNKTEQGQYTTNPYTNPAGYFADTANRWSTSGIQFFYGDNNKVTDVKVQDCQLNGYMGMYTTNMYVARSLFFRNGSSGTDLLRASTGAFEHNICDSNASDQIRVDSCIIGTVNINYCQGSNAQADPSATNWFAGMYIQASNNVHVDKCYFFNNSGYGWDNGSDTTYTNNILTNSTIAYNGNAGVAVNNGATIKNNFFKNNGKTTAGATDTQSGSGYNPAAISTGPLGSISGLIIEGNHSVDTVVGGNWAQIWFMKGSAGAVGYIRSSIVNNYVKGVADTAHFRGTNIGQNNFLNNLVYTNANLPVFDAPNNYVWTYDGTYANGKWALNAAGTVPISGLTAAAATNTINNADYAQEWQWNTLSTNTGLKLTSTSTVGDDSKLFQLTRSGANSTSAKTNYGSYTAITNTGTTSTNIAAYLSASGGTNNYALVIPSSGGRVGIGTVTPTAPLSFVAGTITSGTNGFNMTGTMPSTLSGTTNMNLWTVTGAGSSNQINRAFYMNYSNGYSGASTSVSLEVDNSNASTGNDLRWGTTITNPLGNIGVSSFAYATGGTTGAMIGGYYEGFDGNLNIGIIGKAVGTNRANATNIGVIGNGHNTNVTSPIEIGGYFSLDVTAPTYTSAALIADNGNKAQPIFLARDNGTTVVSIADGGTVYLSTVANGAATDSLLVINTNEVKKLARTALLAQTASVTGSDATTTSDVAGNITGLVLAVAANKRYKIVATLYTGCNNTGGVRFGLTGPASAAVLSGGFVGNSSSATTGARVSRLLNFASLTVAGTLFNAYNGIGVVTLSGFFTTSGTAGNVQMQFASGTNTETSTVYIGSTMEITEVQ